MTKPCQSCGSDMPAKRGNRFCNRCLYAAREPYARTCPDCGREWVSKATGVRCSACKQRAKMTPCIACGKPSDHRAKYCNSCKPVSAEFLAAGRRAREEQRPITAAERYEIMVGQATRTEDGCLLLPDGYGVRGYRRVKADGSDRMAHRVAVEVVRGIVLADTDTVDHTCHNRDATCPGGSACRHRRCIEDTHLEVVDAVTNWSRGTLGVPVIRAEKTHCPAGHPYEGANLYVRKDGSRSCRACRRARSAGRDPAKEPTATQVAPTGVHIT